MNNKPKENHINQLHSEEPRWFAIYTTFKREKLVERMLRQKEIEVYLPIQKKTRQYGKRIRRVEMPLISCYLFVKITRSEYIRVLETEHVMKFIRIAKDLLAIPEAQIDIIRRVTGEGVPLEVENSRASFRKGDLVEIVSGNLTGLEGRLISIDGKNQITIELKSLGYSLRMGIEPSLIRRKNVPVPA